MITYFGYVSIPPEDYSVAAGDDAFLTAAEGLTRRRGLVYVLLGMLALLLLLLLLFPQPGHLFANIGAWFNLGESQDSERSLEDVIDDADDPTIDPESAAGRLRELIETIVDRAIEDLGDETIGDYVESVNTVSGKVIIDDDGKVVVTTVDPTITLSLSDTSVASGTYGNATNVATFTVDAQGRLTAAGKVGIDFVGNAVTSVTAGGGLVGGGGPGAISLDVGAGPGITVGAHDVAISSPTCGVSENLRWTGVAFVCTDVETMAWALGGNALTALNTLGSTTAFDVSLVRNGLTVATMTSSGLSDPQMLFAPGSGALPAMSFIGDPDTGIYRSGADMLDFTVGGTTRLSVDDSSATTTVTGQLAVTTLAAASTTHLCIDGSSVLSTCTPSGVPLSSITAAVATNTIDSLSYAQTWNWSTLTTETAMSLGGPTAATTGSLLSASATYVHGAAETGSLVSLSYSDATSAAFATTTNALQIAPTMATTGSSAHTFNGINVAPTLTSCGGVGGLCSYNSYYTELPALTQSTTNTFNINGYAIGSAGALEQNTAAGTINWRGISVEMPAITQTTGTVNATGLEVRTSTVTTGGMARAINVVDAAGNSLMEVRDMSTANNNFGAAATAGAFISRNSYWGDEFNVFHANTCTRGATANTNLVRGDFGNPAAGACAAGGGQLGFSAVLTASGGADLARAASLAGNYGVERLTATSDAGVGSTSAGLLYLGSAAGTLNGQFAANNLPVLTTKVRPSLVASGSNARFFVGLGNKAVASGAFPTSGIFFSNCTATAVPACAGTEWIGVVTSGGAVVGTVACPAGAETGTINTVGFNYLRIEVRSNTDVHFFVDTDTSTGIAETECGTGITGVGPGGTGLAPMIESAFMAASATTENLDIDFMRIWQDDPPAPTDVPVLREPPLVLIGGGGDVDLSDAPDFEQRVFLTDLIDTGIEETDTSSNVVLQLAGESGFVVKNEAAETLFELDSEGNATLTGVLVADVVQANRFENAEFEQQRVRLTEMSEALTLLTERVLALEILGVDLAARIEALEARATSTPRALEEMGSATVPAGATEIEVVFDREFETLPLVFVTPIGDATLDPMLRYAVVGVTPSRFVIRLGEPLEADATFNWSAV